VYSAIAHRCVLIGVASYIDGAHALRGLYEHDMPLSKKFVYVFDKLLARKASKLRAHIKRQGLPHTAYSFRYVPT
jgi:hypothetical protein